MARNNGNTNHSRSKPQGNKSSGSKQSRQRNHFQYRTFGDTPNSGAQSIWSPKPNTPEIVREPVQSDGARMRSFFETSLAVIDEKSEQGIRLVSISPRIARMIFSKFGKEEADRLLKEYAREHSGNIRYSVSNFYSFGTTSTGSVLLAANPATTTRDRVNQDITDHQRTFGIPEDYTHRSLIIAKYPNQEACDTARTALYETLERQGGVLLTFGGVQV